MKAIEENDVYEGQVMEKPTYLSLVPLKMSAESLVQKKLSEDISVENISEVKKDLAED